MATFEINTSVTPIGHQRVTRGKSVAIEKREFLEDYDLRCKAKDFASEASRRSGDSLMKSTRSAGDQLVEHVVKLHNNEHQGGVETGGMHYIEMVKKMLTPDEEIVVGDDKQPLILPFKDAKVRSPLLDLTYMDFNFMGCLVLTTKRLILVTANPDQAGNMWKGDPTSPSMASFCDRFMQTITCGLYKAEAGERKYMISYSVTENMVFWASPLTAFKAGFDLRISQGAQIIRSISSFNSCLHRVICSCCTGAREYNLFGDEITTTVNVRSLSLPFLLPPWEDKAKLVLQLPNQDDKYLGGTTCLLTNSYVHEFMAQFQHQAIKAGAKML